MDGQTNGCIDQWTFLLYADTIDASGNDNFLTDFTMALPMDLWTNGPTNGPTNGQTLS